MCKKNQFCINAREIAFALVKVRKFGLSKPFFCIRNGWFVRTFLIVADSCQKQIIIENSPFYLVTAVFGEYAPLAVAASSSVGSSASADVSAINCKKEPRLDTILANQKQLKKNLKEIKELVMENGRSIEKVEEKVEFNTIVGMYGNEIISLRTAEKAFLKNLRFDRDGAIEESPAQRRFMNTALGHQPGSQFRGLAAWNDMITKGVGRYFRISLPLFYLLYH